MPSPLDALQRPLRDLRISVTDKCNFRCPYCMPAEKFREGYNFLAKGKILTFDEITTLARVFCRLGVGKIRITGGEPLLRPRLPDLISSLSSISPNLDIAMTTNGSLLGDRAQELKDAGLSRVTVSLDALDPRIFKKMNGMNAAPGPVCEGIYSALNSGLTVKLNTVVKKNCNEDQILPLVKFSRKHKVQLRFIEYMDTGNINGWKEQDVVKSGEIYNKVGKNYELIPAKNQQFGETAQRYYYKDIPAVELGLISSVSKPFCRDCTRARLSADGFLYTCLFASQGHDLKSSLRARASEEELAKLISQIWSSREDRYSELKSKKTLEKSKTSPKKEMFYLGG